MNRRPFAGLFTIDYQMREPPNAVLPEGYRPELDIRPYKRVWKSLRLRAPDWELVFSDRMWGLLLFVLLLQFGAHMLVRYPDISGDASYPALVLGVGSAASMYLLSGAWWRAFLFLCGLLVLLIVVLQVLASIQIYVVPSQAVANVYTDLFSMLFAGGLVISAICAILSGLYHLMNRSLQRLVKS